ncbi:MAG: UDP-N-acetylmuramate dehydrogenase [Candidatus Peribacteraceae bacterium]|nr:UDP-N-acetylmuramate dehydrogenase [Candidatus Peribacteraceae bacterium]
MNVKEHESLKLKTTMHIGGSARYYAELKTKSDVEEAWQFARKKKVPLLVLGAGSNTIFADSLINALVVRIVADHLSVDGNRVEVEVGRSVGYIVNALAQHDLDLSALTGIPGTLGGALFGNAGQGPKGFWIGHFVESVTAFLDGSWRTFPKEECAFSYRDSVFKYSPSPIILWSAHLAPPSRPQEEITQEIRSLLTKRQGTQPFRMTAGSCFKALSDGTPAWQIIDQAQLRGFRVGGVETSPKHANFLVNTGDATYADAFNLVQIIRRKTGAPLELEMRLIDETGRVLT